jgi:hypothetical protein
MIVEVELQQRNHNLNGIFNIVNESVFQFSGITNNHLTSSCFLFKTCCFDTKSLLRMRNIEDYWLKAVIIENT